MLRLIFISLGIISLTIGLIGIVTPGIPTTPFILLTAYLFTKSSPKLLEKLKANKITSRYLNKVNGGLSVKEKLISIGLMWCMVCFSAFVIFDYGKWRFIILTMGLIGTIAQLIVLRRKKTASLAIEENLINENEKHV
ncbi:YbaN family protein [Dysgonomonas massiliensis]|uniref:YbaN family protein n=1 Tax=Dysgonomonas massiliensis TaxID=2040292 RepID=UPI000C793A39|nr:YbaN family protein [Dysgonomonas massiliensis]